MNETTLEKPFYLKTWHLFLVIIIAVWLNTWILQNYVMTRELYHNLLSEKLEISRIDDYFNFVRKISIFSYILVPIIIWIQLAFVTLLLQFPLVLKFIDIPFKKIFRVVAFAQISLVVMGLIKTFWLLHFQPSQITRQTLSFTPLSLTNFLDISAYPKSAVQVLNNFNVFSIIWCIVLINGLSNTKKIKKLDASILVVVVWTLILVFQWVLVMYFTKINS